MKNELSESIERYAEISKEESVRLLESLGRIPAPSHHEEQRAAFCRSWLISQGAEHVYIDGAKNVVCEIGCDKFEEVVVFMAHMDIVFPDMDSLPMRREGNRLCAPGIGDDTANLVNLLIAAKYLLKEDMHFGAGFVIVANSCEEGLGNLEGGKTICRKYGAKIRAFYSFDGYLPQCCSSAVGSYRFKVTARTKGGHSYLDFGRENAIRVLCSLTEALYEIEPPQEERTTYNVGYIQGGTTVNTIAQEAHMLYEFRSTSQECLKKMEQVFYETVDRFRNEKVQINVDILGIRPGNGQIHQEKLREFTKRNAEIVQRYYKKEMDFKAYSTDSNIPLSMGILANTIGTVTGGGAHTREEWVDLENLDTGVKIILNIMFQYTKVKDGEEND